VPVATGLGLAIDHFHRRFPIAFSKHELFCMVLTGLL
jgi:hypothetical protein